MVATETFTENLSQELFGVFLLKIFSCDFSHWHEEEEQLQHLTFRTTTNFLVHVWLKTKLRCAGVE